MNWKIDNSVIDPHYTRRYTYYIDRKVNGTVWYCRITKDWFKPIEFIAEKCLTLIEEYYKWYKGSRNYAYNNKLWNFIENKIL